MGKLFEVVRNLMGTKPPADRQKEAVAHVEFLMTRAAELLDAHDVIVPELKVAKAGWEATFTFKRLPTDKTVPPKG